MQYYLYSFAPAAKYEFSHTAFTVDTTPITHSLCGPITYSVTFDGVAIGLGSVPMTYDSTSNKWAIYSEDYTYLGMRPITVEAALTLYTQVTIGAALTTEIEIIDPCIDSFAFTVPA